MQVSEPGKLNLVQLPIREAGPGKVRIRVGYDSLTHAKSVLISPPDVAIDHLFPPYTRAKVQALNQWFEY
jgi:hypothetical protein